MGKRYVVWAFGDKSKPHNHSYFAVGRDAIESSGLRQLVDTKAYVAVFPVTAPDDLDCVDRARQHARKFCDYLNELDDVTQAAAQAVAVAARMTGGTNG